MTITLIKGRVLDQPNTKGTVLLYLLPPALVVTVCSTTIGMQYEKKSKKY